MKTGISSPLINYFAAFLKAVIPNKSTLPYFSGVRLTMTDKGNISFFGTDLDRDIHIHNGPPEGDVIFDSVVHCADLLKLAREAGDNPLTIDVPSDAFVSYEKNGVSVEREITAWPTSHFDGVALDYNPKVDTGWLDVGPDFLHGMKVVYPCISTEETRYVLNGAFLNFEDCKWIATDGRRLSSFQTSMPEIPGSLKKSLLGAAGGVIVPDCKLFSGKLLVGHPLQVRIGRRAGKHQTANLLSTRLAFGPMFIDFTTKLIEGNYPNYKQVIPNDKKFSVTFPEISEKVKAIQIEEKDKGIKIELNGSKATFRNRRSSFTVDVLVSGTAPEETFIISIAKDFLLYALDTGLPVADFIDEISPAVFRDDRRCYVVMPMRVAA